MTPPNDIANPPAGITPAKDSNAIKKLLESAQTEIDGLLQSLHSEMNGLTEAEAAARLKQYGYNQVAQEKSKSILVRLLDNIKNPLVILLAVLGLISYLTGDMRAAAVIMVMVVLGVVLRFFQEWRSDKAAENLQAMVSLTATVIRNGEKKDIPLKTVVPGDIVYLSAGDMIPADLRLIAAHDLHINQAALTGESLPVEKSVAVAISPDGNPFAIPNICFLGSSVQVGSATGVAVLTGSGTYFGGLAAGIVGEREPTSFDKGINKFTWLMIKFMAVMVPLVFIINWISKGNLLLSFLFATAVAVGLTPEMLPMIVTVNLAKGALIMARKKVIVKRLNAIQNFGAMDVLCTDKTGTLTQGKVVLIKHLDVDGNDREEILNYAYVNSFFETGLKNIMDLAVLDHKHLDKELIEVQGYKKIDEIPFDFERRRLSVVVEDNKNRHILICKGAVEEVMALCTRIEIQGKVHPLDYTGHHAKTVKLVRELNEQGFRVVALAYKEIPEIAKEYTVADEVDLVLLGFLAFLDPPKESAAEALKDLHEDEVQVKILTGDNDTVTISICKQVGLATDHVLLGTEIEKMTKEELAAAVGPATIFAKLSPEHKERIIRALQQQGHVVGFMGDGINDALALKAADVGISVASAVDIAKESSDIILLEQSLLVLQEGVIEGRKVFANIIKYIKMAASSNFGNMFSILGASIFLPFLPMLPIQIITNNLLYDFSQTAIPTDKVDAEWLVKPRNWDIDDIRRFIMFIGPISSIFDYLTFFLMLSVFQAWNNPALFQTGWFVESIFTQTLIIHVIRTNKIPFLQSRASLPLIATSAIIVAVGAWLPFSPASSMLGFVSLPPLYWPFLTAMLLCYILLTQLVKVWYNRRYTIN